MSPVMLHQASVSQLLEEIARRFDGMADLPDWCSPIIITVAGFYKMPIELVMGTRRNDPVMKVRHLCIALIAQLHPYRTQQEVTDLFQLDHTMYRHAIQGTEEKCHLFPEFRAEEQSILSSLKAQGHCRSAPQVTSRPSAAPAS